MTRALRSGAAALIAVVALAGCARVTVENTISSDGTFSQYAVIAFSEQVAAQIEGEAGVDVDSLFGDLDSSPELMELQEQYPGQVVIDPYDDGELEGVEITVTDLPLEEFNAAASQAASGIGAGATLTQEDGRFIVEMEAPQELGLDGLGVSESQLSLVESSVDVGVTYTFPGLVEEATVGEVDGRSVTVGIADLLSGQDIRIVAGATDSIDWGPYLRWGGVALAFILVVGGATALVLQDRRAHRRSSLPPPTTTADPHGPGLLGPDATATDAAGNDVPEQHDAEQGEQPFGGENEGPTDGPDELRQST